MALEDFDIAVNKELMIIMATKLGKQMPTTGSTAIVEKVIPLFVSNTQSVIPMHNPFVDQEIQLAYNLAKTQSPYAVFGGNRFWSYAESKGMATASAYGYDVAKSGGRYDFIYDLDFDGIYGGDKFITIPYGAVQAVQWNQCVGDGAIDTPTAKQFVVYTRSGLKVDMFWNHIVNDFCNEVRVGFKAYIELVAVPGGGCGLDNDVNGIFKFKDCSLTTSVACP